MAAQGEKNRKLREALDLLPEGCWGVCGYDEVLPLLPCRASSRLPERPHSVIVCLFPYYTGEHAGGNLSRYAVIADYHRVAGNLLEKVCARLVQSFPGDRFAPFVDNSPIREVAAAGRAGLGAIGRNGQLIHPVYGSYVFIGSIVTGLELERSGGCVKSCPGCGRCLAACPTGALCAGGGFLRERCRSHITQKKGELSEWERRQVRSGGMAWGCDLCTDACPLNHPPKGTPIREFYRDIVPCLTPDNLDSLLADKPYGYRGRQVLLRNLALVAEERGETDR